uniref:histidine kinase dimerization/phospho-acceptor domain-containing protein n=1 Tax=Variovorax sp. BK018 TaxID=3450241 RepID=UPI004039A7C7
MFNLLLKAAVASLAAVGAAAALRAISCRTQDRTLPAKTEYVPTWPAARLARIDHDLRTPIGTIANTIELLRGLESDPGAREACEVIERQVGRLTTLIAELHEIVESRDRLAPPADDAGRTRR